MTREKQSWLRHQMLKHDGVEERHIVLSTGGGVLLALKEVEA